jgi:hypothetical protein
MGAVGLGTVGLMMLREGGLATGMGSAEGITGGEGEGCLTAAGCGDDCLTAGHGDGCLTTGCEAEFELVLFKDGVADEGRGDGRVLLLGLGDGLGLGLTAAVGDVVGLGEEVAPGGLGEELMLPGLVEGLARSLGKGLAGGFGRSPGLALGAVLGTVCSRPRPEAAPLKSRRCSAARKRYAGQSRRARASSELASNSRTLAARHSSITSPGVKPFVTAVRLYVSLRNQQLKIWLPFHLSRCRRCMQRCMQQEQRRCQHCRRSQARSAALWDHPGWYVEYMYTVLGRGAALNRLSRVRNTQVICSQTRGKKSVLGGEAGEKEIESIATNYKIGSEVMPKRFESN